MLKEYLGQKIKKLTQNLFRQIYLNLIFSNNPGNWQMNQPLTIYVNQVHKHLPKNLKIYQTEIVNQTVTAMSRCSLPQIQINQNMERRIRISLPQIQANRRKIKNLINRKNFKMNHIIWITLLGQMNLSMEQP